MNEEKFNKIYDNLIKGREKGVNIIDPEDMLNIMLIELCSRFTDCHKSSYNDGVIYGLELAIANILCNADHEEGEETGEVDYIDIIEKSLKLGLDK